MSSGAVAKKPGRLSSALSLLVVFALLFVASRLAPEYKGDLGAIAAVGFLLLGGALMAEVLEPIRVPHLTGYLACGIIAGPNVLHLIEHESVHTLAKVNSLALALIALAGGAELRLSTLRAGLRSLAWSTLLQSVGGLVCVGTLFFTLKPLIPFARDFTFGGMVGLSILWGVLATTRSPSATLGILSQTRAQGPLARYALGFVMTSDIVVVIALALAFTVSKPLLVPGSTFSSAAFKELGHEVLGSVAIGTTLGLLLAAYIRLIHRQLVVVLVALGFGAWEVLRYLNFDPLLTFMVAGFVVQNLSKQGDKLLHEIEETGGIVYVIFFAIAGAELDVPLLRKLWLVTLILCGGRMLISFAFARIASRIADDPPSVKRWGFAPLISQAGIALGIASLVEKQFPSFGSGFKAIAVAAVAVNELVGPIIFKIAVDSTGESRAHLSSLPDPEDAHATEKISDASF